MIGHEDVGLDGDAIASAIAFEAVQIGGIILLIMENSRTAVAADDHMIEGAGEVDTWFTGHWGWILRPSPPSNQYSGLTPFHPTLRPDPIPSDETPFHPTRTNITRVRFNIVSPSRDWGDCVTLHFDEQCSERARIDCAPAATTPRGWSSAQASHDPTSSASVSETVTITGRSDRGTGLDATSVNEETKLRVTISATDLTPSS